MDQTILLTGMVAAALAGWPVVFILGQRCRPKPPGLRVPLAQPTNQPSVLLPPCAPANFELLHEVDGEFVPAGAKFSGTEDQLHAELLKRQGVTGRAHAANRIATI